MSKRKDDVQITFYVSRQTKQYMDQAERILDLTQKELILRGVFMYICEMLETPKRHRTPKTLTELEEFIKTTGAKPYKGDLINE